MELSFCRLGHAPGVALWGARDQKLERGNKLFGKFTIGYTSWTTKVINMHAISSDQLLHWSFHTHIKTFPSDRIQYRLGSDSVFMGV